MCLLKTNFRYKLLRILTTQIGPKSLMTPSVARGAVGKSRAFEVNN